METLAELPFIGDQVVFLSHNQAARSGPGDGRYPSNKLRLHRVFRSRRIEHDRLLDLLRAVRLDRLGDP